jgi:hypothetical protein
MRLHVAGPVQEDKQLCVVCRELLFDDWQDKVTPGTRIAESMGGDGDRDLEALTAEESLPLGLYACKPPA